MGKKDDDDDLKENMEQDTENFCSVIGRLRISKLCEIPCISVYKMTLKVK